MRFLIPTLIIASIASPATADVVAATPTTFEIDQQVTIDAPLDKVWDTLRSPQKWWSKDHTYSDDSANLYLETQAGGCFCERLPDNGSVEHAHIVYIQPPRMIRLKGALGPLQAEAVDGTLSFKLDAESPTATRLTLVYIVSGYVRAGADTMAPKVDDVLALQLSNLKAAAELPPPSADNADKDKGR